ncbi:hypothetical protein BD779DRAFT_1533336 [Infundibulicybe gibba]|nr:hypothetical protein BD779DRAFT_1533336 [Infundibulicybe gibba]
MCTSARSWCRTSLSDGEAGLQRGVNKVVQRYVNQGIAEVIPRVIDEVRMPDIKCFTC